MRISDGSSDVCSSDLDLPIPGSPPISVAEPATSPPPSARSSSPMPVESRFGSAVSTFSASSDSLRPPFCVCCFWAKGDAAGALPSTTVFHAPQSAHCPCPSELAAPQDGQTSVLTSRTAERGGGKEGVRRGRH